MRVELEFELNPLTPKGPRPFLCQKTLKTAPTTAFIETFIKKTFFENLIVGSCTRLLEE